jgi:hypothetical protein
MANLFMDANGNAVGYLTVDIVSGETQGPITFEVLAAAGNTFFCQSVPGLSVTARRTGLGSFSDLTRGIDLSLIPAGVQSFDVFFQCTLASGRLRTYVAMGVDAGGQAAAWT